MKNQADQTDADQLIGEVRGIRGTIEQAIADGSGAVPKHQRTRSRLEQIIATCNKAERAEAVEAEILLNVVHRLRPARTVNLLKMLQNIRTDAYAIGAFDLFSQRVDDYLHPHRVTTHGYNSTLASYDADEIWSTLAKRIGAISGTSQIFLNSGTLLGAVREGGLLQHDDDLDLAVVLDASTPQEAATEWLDLCDRLLAEGLLVPEDTSRTGKKIFKLHPIGGIQIDLFPCWLEGDKVWLYPHTTGQLTRNDLLPLKAAPIKGFFVPADPEKMLAVNYGKGWVTPDPYFSFDWARAGRRFAKFLKALTEQSKAREKVSSS